MSLKYKKLIWFLLCAVCVCLIVYFLGWFLASASLASGYCISKGGFDLFHEEYRCRQPFLALIGMAVFFFSGLLCLVRGIKLKYSD